jgi:phthalate 4,5-dioxygenase reductase component
MDDARLELALRVKEAYMVASEIRSFTLVREDGQPLPSTQTGGHIKVAAPNGMVRNYSLCNIDGETTHYQIAVKRDAKGRGGSISMVDELHVGDLVRCSTPSNAFSLVPSEAGYIFIAGGIGITPILSMIRTLTDRTAPPKLWRLFYLARAEADAAFVTELRAHENVMIHFDGGDVNAAFDLWPELETPSGQHVYCCGPSGLMDSVRDMTGHWPESQIHFESFLDASGPREEDIAFDIHLLKSQRTVHVAKTMSALQALRAQGVVVASSCESGSCGTCKTPLISGEADHRDFVLHPDERKSYFMPCVSRAKQGALRLDL